MRYKLLQSLHKLLYWSKLVKAKYESRAACTCHCWFSFQRLLTRNSP